MNNKPLTFELFSSSQELNTTQHLKILKKIRMVTKLKHLSILPKFIKLWDTSKSRNSLLRDRPNHVNIYWCYRLQRSSTAHLFLCPLWAPVPPHPEGRSGRPGVAGPGVGDSGRRKCPTPPTPPSSGSGPWRCPPGGTGNRTLSFCKEK